jgi:hypothetical protein
MIILFCVGAFAADNAHYNFHYTETLPIEPQLQNLYSTFAAKKPSESASVPACAKDLITTFTSHAALHDKDIRAIIFDYCSDDKWEPFKFYCMHEQLGQRCTITKVQFSDHCPQITVQFSTQLSRYDRHARCYNYETAYFSASHPLVLRTIYDKHSIFDEIDYPFRVFKHNPAMISPTTTVHAYSPQDIYYAQVSSRYNVNPGSSTITLYRNKHKLLAKALTYKIITRDEEAQPAKKDTNSLCVIL